MIKKIKQQIKEENESQEILTKFQEININIIPWMVDTIR